MLSFYWKDKVKELKRRREKKIKQNRSKCWKWDNVVIPVFTSISKRNLYTKLIHFTVFFDFHNHLEVWQRLLRQHNFMYVHTHACILSMHPSDFFFCFCFLHLTLSPCLIDCWWYCFYEDFKLVLWRLRMNVFCWKCFCLRKMLHVIVHFSIESPWRAIDRFAICFSFCSTFVKTIAVEFLFSIFLSLLHLLFLSLHKINATLLVDISLVSCIFFRFRRLDVFFCPCSSGL